MSLGDDIKQLIDEGSTEQDATKTVLGGKKKKPKVKVKVKIKIKGK